MAPANACTHMYAKLDTSSGQPPSQPLEANALLLAARAQFIACWRDTGPVPGSCERRACSSTVAPDLHGARWQPTEACA
jgi:hypothetical protein